MRDLLALEYLTAREILDLLELAESLREILDRPTKKVPTLRGRAIANVFFEPSTRTRSSFELAGKYLSADVINFQAGGSSVAKGETVWDTVDNLVAMGIDAVVVRHSASGVPMRLADRLKIPVINAGDGWHEHPTQGLLDLLTVKQRLGRLEGLRVSIVGDILHSRVARSDIWGFQAMGAHVTVVGPPGLIPSGFEGPGVQVETDLEAGLLDADVVIALRIQKERQSLGDIPSLRDEYRSRWGITIDRLQHVKPDVLLMHPGPQNRGVEMDSELIDGPLSVIYPQVTNGVAVRMAVLYRLLGGSHA